MVILEQIPVHKGKHVLKMQNIAGETKPTLSGLKQKISRNLYKKQPKLQHNTLKPTPHDLFGLITILTEQTTPPELRSSSNISHYQLDFHLHLMGKN